MSKRPKLDHQRTASNNDNREETSSVVEYEYTGKYVPNNVTHVRIHPSITSIQIFSFHNKLRLKEVVLNEGLTVIGQNAFGNCSSLECMTLPSTVIDIGASAFINCSSLTEVVLNEGIKRIGKDAFACCESLQSINIPSTVTEIGSFAFYCCNSLREVVLAEGLKKIGESLFRSCRALESITLPSTVTEIGESAFANCRNLQEVVLHENLQKIGREAFSGCSTLERFTVPSKVTCIEKETFKGCSNLREVKLHDGIWTMGDDVFVNCHLLDGLLLASTSTRLSNIVSAGQVEIETKIDVIINNVFPGVWRPLVRRGSELSIYPEIQGLSLNWSTIKQCINRIVGLITYYEVREATTLFELALWKSKIDQADISSPSSDRGAYRVEVPGPVKDTVLQYLWPGGGIGIQLSNALDGLLNFLIESPGIHQLR